MNVVGRLVCLFVRYVLKGQFNLTANENIVAR
jgi:hypothetical protein